MLARKLMGAAGGGAESQTYVDDCFSCFLYTGNGSMQTINNGIDLAGEGGLVWAKSRSNAYVHTLYDTARGSNAKLLTNSTVASTTVANSFYSFNNNGFTIGGTSDSNSNSDSCISWTFRRAPKFFDVQTATLSSGNATVSFTDLSTLGMVIVKRTDSTGDWYVWHRSLTAGKLMYLNQTAAEATLGHITVSGTTLTLVDGTLADGSYICYAFAHDTEEDGIIQCGSYTGNGSASPPIITLGWEPQYLLAKKAGSTGDWCVLDTMRGWTVGTTVDAEIKPNGTAAEVATNLFSITTTGFSPASLGSAFNNTDISYIYLAIRRPNKPPTSGTEVYACATRTGTGAAVTTTSAGFSVDLSITKKRSSTTLTGARFVDRLRGAKIWLDSTVTHPETINTDTVTGLDVMTGFKLGADATTSAFNTSSHTYVDHYFRRAPGI